MSEVKYGMGHFSAFAWLRIKVACLFLLKQCLSRICVWSWELMGLNIMEMHLIELWPIPVSSAHLTSVIYRKGIAMLRSFTSCFTLFCGNKLQSSALVLQLRIQWIIQLFLFFCFGIKSLVYIKIECFYSSKYKYVYII